jgi:3-oxoacyl-[acyl-carrier protein] reductase
VTWDFHDDVAVVTGGAQGIGRATADRLGEAGASLSLVDVDDAPLERAADELRDADIPVEAIHCDVSSFGAVERMVGRTRDRFGSIDVLVNNAGVVGSGSVAEMAVEEWKRVLDVNLTGQFHCLRSVAPEMIDAGGGRIVNVSSMAGRDVSHHGGANYTASKWGVIGLTKHAALDLGPHGVRVNAVCPGVTRTPLVDARNGADRLDAFRDGIPLGRLATPEDQADAIAYLLSDRSTFITGSVVEVDGGGSLGTI